VGVPGVTEAISGLGVPSFVPHALKRTPAAPARLVLHAARKNSRRLTRRSLSHTLNRPSVARGFQYTRIIPSLDAADEP